MKWQHNEPFFWGLFGAGGVLTAFLLPVLIFITGIAVPLGLLPADALSFERMQGFASSWIGLLLILGGVALTLWHAAHRIFHGLHDLGFHPGGGARLVSYGTAVCGAGLTLALLLAL